MTTVIVTYRNNETKGYDFNKETRAHNDWSRYTKVTRQEVQMNITGQDENQPQEDSDMTGYDMELCSIYATDKVYQRPIAVWNKVYQEFWYASSSSELQQINESYNRAFDINKATIGEREDGSWAQADRLVQAEKMLVELGVSRKKISRAFKLINDCFLAGGRYGDFRDGLSDFLMEEVVMNSDGWAKKEEIETKLADLRITLDEHLPQMEELDEAIVKYAMEARKMAWEHVKRDMKENATTEPNWELYNGARTEYSKALMPKVSKKVGYLEKMAYMKLMSYVGTRYWQVVLGRTEDMMMLKARYAAWSAVTELLGSCFSEFIYEFSQDEMSSDRKGSNYDLMNAETIRDMDENQAAELIMLNNLYREMDHMACMSEKERMREIVNR